MYRLALIMLSVGSCIPGTAMAIELTEVAWMGSVDSANHEWIELHSPETIDVTGWSISDGSNLIIELTGSINAGEYAVLERTSDDSAPGVAWDIYTGALVNTGATLTLYDATGAVVDRVVGGDNWQSIGGDNATKATAQLTSNGWITADPTPGQAASGVVQDVPDNDTDVSDTNSSASVSSGSSGRSSSASQSIQLTLPDVTLQLAIEAPPTTYINQPVTFSVAPSGVGTTIANSLQYTWSFGDTHTATGQTVDHAYSHAGNYVVVVEAAYKRQIQRVRHEIVVLPVVLSLALLDDGHVAIQNNSQTEIDIAGYRLVGSHSFTIPDYTIVLPRSQIVVPREKLVTTPVSQMIALYDHAGDQAAIYVPEHLAAVVNPNVAVDSPVPSVSRKPTSRISAIDDSPLYTFATGQTIDSDADTERPATTTAIKQSLQVAGVGKATLSLNWAQYTFIGLLIFGILAVYLIPRPRKDVGPLG